MVFMKRSVLRRKGVGNAPARCQSGGCSFSLYAHFMKSSHVPSLTFSVVPSFSMAAYRCCGIGHCHGATNLRCHHLLPHASLLPDKQKNKNKTRLSRLEALPSLVQSARKSRADAKIPSFALSFENVATVPGHHVCRRVRHSCERSFLHSCFNSFIVF